MWLTSTVVCSLKIEMKTLSRQKKSKERTLLITVKLTVLLHFILPNLQKNAFVVTHMRINIFLIMRGGVLKLHQKTKTVVTYMFHCAMMRLMSTYVHTAETV